MRSPGRSRSPSPNPRSRGSPYRSPGRSPARSPGRSPARSPGRSPARSPGRSPAFKGNTSIIDDECKIHDYLGGGYSPGYVSEESEPSIEDEKEDEW